MSASLDRRLISGCSRSAERTSRFVRKNGHQLFGLSRRLEIVKAICFGVDVLNIIFRMERSTCSSSITAKTRASPVESPLDPARKARNPAIGALSHRRATALALAIGRVRQIIIVTWA